MPTVVSTGCRRPALIAPSRWASGGSQRSARPSSAIPRGRASHVPPDRPGLGVAGLDKSSLYNAFGSKDELFRRVLDRYLDVRMGMLEELSRGEGGLGDLLAIFEFMRAEVTGESGCRGCLGVNSSAELGNQNDWIVDYGARYRTLMRTSFSRVLGRAVDLGEIDGAFIDVYTDTINGLAMSLTIFARSGAPADELHRVVDSMAALVGTWRVGPEPATSGGPDLI